MIAYNFLQSCQLLGDSMDSFNERCLVGLEPNEDKIKEYLNESLMLVTALNPHIGYENAAKIAKYAHENNLTLRESAIKQEILTGEKFDELVKPEEMTRPNVK